MKTLLQYIRVFATVVALALIGLFTLLASGFLYLVMLGGAAAVGIAIVYDAITHKKE